MCEVNSEHYRKYEELWIAKGSPNYDHLIPATRQEIRELLDAGDEHLNTIPLGRWDIGANWVGWTHQQDGKKYYTLAEQVCLLKHYARYHFLPNPS